LTAASQRVLWWPFRKPQAWRCYAVSLFLTSRPSAHRAGSYVRSESKILAPKRTAGRLCAGCAVLRYLLAVLQWCRDFVCKFLYMALAHIARSDISTFGKMWRLDMSGLAVSGWLAGWLRLETEEHEHPDCCRWAQFYTASIIGEILHLHVRWLCSSWSCLAVLRTTVFERYAKSIWFLVWGGQPNACSQLTSSRVNVHS